MSTAEDLAAALRTEWCADFDVVPSGDGEVLVVDTPFLFDDGDALPVLLRPLGEGWRLTDDGATVAHLFFDDFEATEPRVRTIHRVIEALGFNIDQSHSVSIDIAAAPSASDIADFIQAIAQIRGVAMATQQEREQTRFATKIRSAITERLTTPDWEENWQPQELETTRASYRSDLKIEGTEPIAVFIASTSERTKTAAITVEQYKRHHVDVRPLLAYRRDTVSDEAVFVFEDFAEIADSVLAIDDTNTITLLHRLRALGVPVSTGG